MERIKKAAMLLLCVLLVLSITCTVFAEEGDVTTVQTNENESVIVGEEETGKNSDTNVINLTDTEQTSVADYDNTYPNAPDIDNVQSVDEALSEQIIQNDNYDSSLNTQTSTSEEELFDNLHSTARSAMARASKIVDLGVINAWEGIYCYCGNTDSGAYYFRVSEPGIYNLEVYNPYIQPFYLGIGEAYADEEIWSGYDYDIPYLVLEENTDYILLFSVNDYRSMSGVEFSLQKIDNIPTIVKGDLLGKGKPTLGSFSLLGQFLLHKKTLNYFQMQAADMNDDGKISMKDFAMLGRALLGNR